MSRSIAIVGPQGCGKTLNASELAKAYGFKYWIDWTYDDDVPPPHDHLILTHDASLIPKHIECVPFREAMRCVKNPHPHTPRPYR